MSDPYRDALALIAAGHVFDAPAFARAVLDGMAPQRAHEADIAGMNEPHDADAQVAIDEALKRWQAQRALVRAALAWYEATTPAVWAADVALQRACKAYRAAGGGEEAP